MREIKFRAWVIESNRMVYDPYFFERRLNDTGYRFYKDWRELEDSRSADCELMQFTGLTDKNGKEIYEGDILGLEDRPDCFREVVFVDGYTATLPLEPVRRANARPSPFWIEDSQLLVIGNIYENPELLEDK